MITLIIDLWKRKYLLWELIKREIVIRYRRSYLGLIWSLLEPLLTTIVLTIVFGTLFNNQDKTYPIYIMCGRLVYSFFSSGTKSAAKSIRGNAGMIKKVNVPKHLYPLSDILAQFVVFILSLFMLIPVALYCRVQITYRIFYVFVPMILILILTCGVGMFIGTISVFFRDTEYMWNIATMFIMYSSAIFYYPKRLLKSGFGWILKYNPVYCIIDTFRACVMGNSLGERAQSMAYALVIGLVSVLIGLIVFKRHQNDFVLHI